MKSLHVPCRLALLALVLFVGNFVHSGCSKKDTLVLDNTSFSSAPAELREKWSAAAQDVAHRNYLGAATNLIDIFSKAQQLTPEQSNALNDTWLKLGNEAFDAANQGDKGATEAVLKMKESRIGNQRNRR
jgi:hypothetical protein